MIPLVNFCFCRFIYLIYLVCYFVICGVWDDTQNIIAQSQEPSFPFVLFFSSSFMSLIHFDHLILCVLGTFVGD